MKFMAQILALLGGGDAGGTKDPFNVYTTKLLEVVKDLLTPIFAVLATVGVVWAIVLGVQYMKAESTDKKEEAKKRMVNVIVGTVIMLVMVMILLLVTSGNNLQTLVNWVSGSSTGK